MTTNSRRGLTIHPPVLLPKGMLAEKTAKIQTPTMVRLADIQKQADELSREDRAGLLAHLLYTLEGAPQGPADQDVLERDRELESGKASAISHDRFVREARSSGR